MKISEFVFPVLKYKRTCAQLGAWAAIGTFVIAFLVTVAIDLHADACRSAYGYSRGWLWADRWADSWIFGDWYLIQAFTEGRLSLVVKIIAHPVRNGPPGTVIISVPELVQAIVEYRLVAYLRHALIWLGVLAAVLAVQTAFVIGFAWRRQSRMERRWIWPAVKYSMLASQTWVVLMGLCISVALLIHLFDVAKSLASIPLIVQGILLWLIGLGTPLAVWGMTASQAATLVMGSADETLCKKCGYSLLGLTEPRCPECGQAFEAAKLEGLNAAAVAAASGGVEKS